MRKIVSLLLVLSLAVLSGCAIRKDLTESEKRLEADMKERMDYKKGLEPFAELDVPYIAAYTTSMANGHSYMKGRNITIRENGAYLADLGDKVATATGVIVRYSPDLAKRRDVVNTTMDVKYSGPLNALLDKIAAYYNISWEYDRESNTVVFYYLKSETFTIPAYLTDIDIRSEISNESDSSDDASVKEIGGATGENTQAVKARGRYSAWDEFLKNIAAMITKDGSVVVSKGSGTVTVTESPVILQRVREYIRTVSNKLARQVSINVRVYNYRTQDEFNLGANIHGLFNDGYTLLNFGEASVAGAGGFSAVVLPNTDPFHKNWAGTQGFIDAMKSKGRMELQTTASGITQNNMPLPVQALRRTSYLAASSTTMNGDNAETSLTPGQVVSGTAIMVTPHIQPDDVINLEYNMTYSVIDAMNRIEAGHSAIEAPDVSSRSIMQRFQIRSNSTIIIAGYASTSKGENGSGRILGFNFGTSDDKEYVIIIIEVNDATLPAYRDAENGV